MKIRWRGVGAVLVLYGVFLLLMLAIKYPVIWVFVSGVCWIGLTVLIYKFGFWKDGEDR